MLVTRREVPVLVTNLIYVPGFTLVALGRSNYEFLMYALVILVIGGLVLWKQRQVRFDLSVLWGLTIWGLLHMAGGNIPIGDTVLYGAEVIPIVDTTLEGERVVILRYDQLVHAFGFGVATLLCHHLLKPYLRERAGRPVTLCVLIVLMGSGVGALNEIIEFAAVLLMPETGVGGYYNTSLDLVCNLVGGLAAAAWIAHEDRLRRGTA